MNKAYLTKDAASKRSGRSVRRLLELASAGRIRKKIVRDVANGNRELAVFHAGDIDQLAKGKMAPPAPLQISGPVRPVVALPQGDIASRIPSVAPRAWLTIAEAAEYCGLPASFLHTMVVQEKLPALDVGPRPGGRWRVARSDIDGIAATRDGFPVSTMKTKEK